MNKNSISQYTQRFIILITILIAIGSCIIITSDQFISFKQLSSDTSTEKIADIKAMLKRLVEREIFRIEESRQYIINREKEGLKQSVEGAASLCESFIENHRELSNAEIMKIFIRSAEKYNSTKTQYKIAIHSLDGTSIFSSESPKEMGTNLFHVKDKFGHFDTQNEIEALEKEKRTFLISSTEVGEYEKQETKISYVYKLEKLNCYLVSNSYSDDYLKELEEAEGKHTSFRNYSHDGNLFIISPDGKNYKLNSIENELSKVSPEYEKSIKESTKQIISSIKLNPDGSFVDYNVSAPDGEAHKIAYVKYYSSCNWIIGIGVSRDKINTELNDKLISMRKSAIQKTLFILLFCILLIIVEYAILREFRRRLVSDFQVFNDYFQEGEALSLHIEPEKLWFKDTKDMANYVNQMNSNLKKAFQDLHLEHEKAEESDRLKTAFLANLSHEVRTPMNAIVGLSAMLNDCDDDVRKELVELINESSSQLLLLIEDTVEISKLESSTLEITRSPIKLGHIFKLVQTFYFSECKRLGKTFEFHSESNLGSNFSFNSDEKHLFKIIRLLLANAIKFTNAGKITFDVSLNDEHILFKITDTGIGIPKDKLDIIFNRFTQADDSHAQQLTRDYRGVGIGLTLARQITEAMDGEIWAESKVGEGSSFLFQIPYIHTN